MSELTDETLHPTKNPLASFAFSPLDVSFENQDGNEQVVLLLRRHWVTNVGWILAATFFFIIPLFLPSLFSWGGASFYESLELRWRTVLFMIWYLLLSGFIFERFINWYFNVYLITNKRIIDVDFHGILYKNVTEAQLLRIQDITHRSAGFLATFFNYGDLLVQTAAEVNELSFEKVPHPADVHKILSDLIEDIR